VVWREAKPNSDKTNIPVLLWRADENNTASVALAFGLYNEEFKNLNEKENLKIRVKDEDSESRMETVLVHLDFPKDEKLARKVHGLAAAGSDYLCTYCEASRKAVSDPPYSGSARVTLTSTLLAEASYYCNLNPGKKSQEQIVKQSHGVKGTPITSVEPEQAVPDALHLDLNVTHHLITIACRIYHFGGQKKPTFQYNKTELLKKDLEKSEAKYYSKLREQITSLPELTQFPGNFCREFCDEKNSEFIKEPLPTCPQKITWCRLMVLWRAMRMIHKSNSDPTVEQISLFSVMAKEFQEKIYSLQWVPAANQVHRLAHVAYFMQSREVRSIGAFSLEGLEHGNWSTKYFESTRVWRGDSKVGNKQLFRLLRWNGSPTLKRAAESLERAKRKPDKCSRCGQSGHKKNMSVCPLYNQPETDDASESEEEEQSTEGAATETEEEDSLTEEAEEDSEIDDNIEGDDDDEIDENCSIN
jgi:hypothetical protein